MPSEVAVPAEHLAAGRAMVRLDVRVREKVCLQVAPLIETPGADRTLVRRFLHVQDLVDSQGPALAESLAALRAFERLFLAVDVPATDRTSSFSRFQPDLDDRRCSRPRMAGVMGLEGLGGLMIVGATERGNFRLGF